MLSNLVDAVQILDESLKSPKEDLDVQERVQLVERGVQE